MPRRPKKLIRRPAGTDSFAASTEAFAGSPEPDMDAFSEILGGVVLKGAMFFSAEFSAPWGFDAPAAQDLAPMLAPGAPHLQSGSDKSTDAERWERASGLDPVPPAR